MGVAMLGGLLGVDAFIDNQQRANSMTRWAYLDGVAHGATALAVTAPIWLRLPARMWLKYFFVAGLLGGLIDLDHIVAAGSFELEELITQPTRPPTHSLTFALTLAVTGALVMKDRLMGWVIFVTLASHVVRDASGFHTPLFWPLSRPHSMPHWLYLVTEVLLLYASFYVARKTPREQSA